MAMEEQVVREGRFVRAHVALSIDMDETVAGENDSVTQQRKQEHRWVRKHEDSSEQGAFYKGTLPVGFTIKVPSCQSD